MFNGCGIIKVNEAASQALATPMKPRLLNLVRRFFAMTESYHASQHSLFSSKKRIRRFWKRISAGKVSVCWPWLGATTPAGYGHLRNDTKDRMAHPWAY